MVFFGVFIAILKSHEMTDVECDVSHPSGLLSLTPCSDTNEINIFALHKVFVNELSVRQDIFHYHKDTVSEICDTDELLSH